MAQLYIGIYTIFDFNLLFQKTPNLNTSTVSINRINNELQQFVTSREINVNNRLSILLLKLFTVGEERNFNWN